MGRIAAAIVLAGLAIAVGMALPNPPAAAYDGYTYTQRVCQEYGQQPRWYRVRDPIPGSDWRNDGGWAIVLERGSNVSPPVYSFGAITATNGIGEGPYAARTGALSNNIGGNGNGMQNQFGRYNSRVGGLDSGTYITAQDGRAGWVNGFSNWIIVDRVKDGVMTTADIFQHGGQWYWEQRTYAVVDSGSNYGTQYIRWANLMYCR